jgi:hypothetical protein
MRARVALHATSPTVCLCAAAVETAPAVYVKNWLEDEVRHALSRAFGDAAADAKPMVTAGKISEKSQL